MSPGSNAEKSDESPGARESSIDSGAVPSSPEPARKRPCTDRRSVTPRTEGRYGLYMLITLTCTLLLSCDRYPFIVSTPLSPIAEGKETVSVCYAICSNYIHGIYFILSISAFPLEHLNIPINRGRVSLYITCITHFYQVGY